MLKLFPDVLIRVSARPFPKLESLTLRNTSTILTELETTRAGLEILKNTLSDALHSLIGQITDSVLQNRLLNLRRDIFNNRPISAYFTPELQQVYTTQLAQQLNSYTEILQQIEQLLAKGEQEYTSELLKIRGNLKLLASDEQLQKGLILSSQVLLEQVKTYIAKKSESLDKKDIQTEKGIIKYLTRMYTKTSPFSTFTNLTIGKIASTENTSAYLHTKEENVSVLSHIRLNNALFQYLKTLFYKNKTMYLYFRLRPNPTIRREEESYVYLTNHQNIEAFQRMPYNQVLELMLEITSEKKEGVLFNEIIKNIIENEYIDASAEQLEGYIQQLIEYGFLEYNLGVSGIDPDWDIHLIQKIGEIKRITHILTNL